MRANTKDGGLSAAVMRDGQIIDNVRFGYTVSDDGLEIKFTGGNRDRL